MPPSVAPESSAPALNCEPSSSSAPRLVRVVHASQGGNGPGIAKGSNLSHESLETDATPGQVIEMIVELSGKPKVWWSRYLGVSVKTLNRWMADKVQMDRAEATRAMKLMLRRAER